jgi:hypothetical protein
VEDNLMTDPDETWVPDRGVNPEAARVILRGRAQYTKLISIMRTFNRLEPSRSFPPEGSENCTTVLSSPTLPGWRSTDASVTQGDPMTDFSKSCPVPTADDGVSP